MNELAPGESDPPVVPMERSQRLIDRDMKTARALKRALDLRIQGADYAQIGKNMGCSYQHARRLVMKAVRNIYREEAEKYLQLEYAKLDKIECGAWKRFARGGDDREKASYLMLELMKTRFKLMGMFKEERGPNKTRVLMSPDKREYLARILIEAEHEYDAKNNHAKALPSPVEQSPGGLDPGDDSGIPGTT